MEPQTHPDPFAEAAGHGIQRVIQIASSVATGAQVLAYLRRERARTDAQQAHQDRRALAAQMRAEQAATRANLAAIGDPHLLKAADLGKAAQAWGAAMPYTDPAQPWYDPAAAAAMRHAEERLRVLHPTAMARYDRLRSEGVDPADAMRQAAPMFGYPPRAHDTPHRLPRSLTTSTPVPPQRPDSGPVQIPPSRSPQLWQQDFPLPIGEVLAATMTSETTAPRRLKPAARSRASRAGRQS
jgi:hypothetical protein